jgi:hypothetical protein
MPKNAVGTFVGNLPPKGARLRFRHLCTHELEGCAGTATETAEVPARNVYRMIVASIGSGLAKIVEYRRIGRR